MNLNTTTVVLTMTSREIAELTGKQHKNIMRDIRNMTEALITSSDLNPCVKSTTYVGADGRNYDQYELDKDTCLTLLLGYDPVARMKVVKRWQELEASKLPQLPTDYITALEHLLEAKKNEQKLLLTITEQKPKVEFVDNFVDSAGLKSFRKVAKILGINERKFRSFLKEEKIMYLQNKDWLPYAEHLNANRFKTKTGESDGRAFTISYFTPKGEVWIAELLKANNLID